MLTPGFGRMGLVAALALAATPLHAAMPTIAPHRAVYDLDLDPSQAAGSTDIEGRLVLEATGTACEGFTVNTRFVTRIVEGSKELVNDMRSATWEAGDGSSYRFLTKNYLNSKLTEQTDGSATRDDGAISVELRAPQQTEFSLDSGILFPSQHVRRLLEAAEAGETIVVADVYDGSDSGSKTFATTAVIGARRQPGRDAGAVGDEVLGGLDSWPVTVGYFDKDADDLETPTYEFSYDLFANGVSRRIVLDYGDFTLVGDLAAIEFLPADPCEQ